MSMKVNIKKNAAVLSVMDELILDNITDFNNTLSRLISDKKYFVVLDLSGLDFISSRGLGAIGKSADLLRRHSGDLKVVSAKPEIKRIFDICGLSSIIEFYENEEDALLSFGDTVGNIEKQLLWNIQKKDRIDD